MKNEAEKNYCLECGKENPPSLGNRPRKYCSRKCMDVFLYRLEVNKGKKPDPPTPCMVCGTLVPRFSNNRPKKYCSKRCSSNPNWVQHEIENKWIDQNCVSKEEVAKSLNLTAATISNRMKKLGLTTHFKHISSDGGPGYSLSYVKKADVATIRDIHSDKKIPEGYVNKTDAARLLEISESSLDSKFRAVEKKTGVYPVDKIHVQVCTPDNVSGVSIVLVYKIEDLLSMKTNHPEMELTCKNCEKNFISIYSDKLYCTGGCKKAASMARRKVRIRKEIKQRGLLTLDEASLQIGASKHWIAKNLVNRIKFGSGGKGRIYVDPKEIEVLSEKRLQELQDREVYRFKAKKKDKIIRRPKCTWLEKELEYISKLPERIKSLEDKHGSDSSDYRSGRACAETIWNQNLAVIRDRMAVLLPCKACGEEKPYYEFNIELKIGPKRARRPDCKACVTSRNKGKKTINPTGRAKMRPLFYTSIKRHINNVNGEYVVMSMKKVWSAIEKHCGYNSDQLADHLESQFTKNMNWENHGRPSKPGEFAWQVDHIKPHSKFKYDSLDHPDFAECWSLSNLRPLEAVMNLQKADKDLYTKFSISFRKGIHRAHKGKVYSKGIWRHLNYTNIEAYKHLMEVLKERTFNFDDWGTEWQLDHKVPVSFLAYTSPEQDNFKKCWSLENLQPLTRFENSSKGSRYNNKFWLHNYEDKNDE